MNELDKLIDEALMEEDDKLLRDADGPEHKFSESYTKDMRSIIAGKTRRKIPDRIARKLFSVAIVAAIIVAAMTVTADSWLPYVKSYVLVEHDKFTELSTGKRLISSDAPINYKMPEGFGSYWSPQYLPEGYSFSGARLLTNSKQICFSNGIGSIVLSQYKPTSEPAQDNEGLIVPDIMVGEFKAYAIEKEIDEEPIRSVTWSNDAGSFNLTGPESFEDLSAMGASLLLMEG